MAIELKGSYYAKAYYKGDGATRRFAVPFPYIAKSHVVVFVDGNATGYDWNNDGTVTLFGIAPDVGERIEVRRVTPRDECIVQYSDYHGLTADMLNMQDLQFLFLFQEDLDYLVDVAIGNIGGGGDPDDDGGGTGGGTGSGPTLPPIAIDLDKLREEILKQILEELDKTKKDMDELIRNADERIREGLDRLQKELTDKFVDAGIIVDPDTGTIVFQVIEDLKTDTGHRFNDVWEKLDAHEAALSMGASSIIAEEILKRITNVELALDAMNASIDLKVTQVTEELKGDISKELKEASLNLDAKLGEIHLEVKRLYIDGLEERLSKAELYLAANGAELGGIVYDFKNILDKIDELNLGIINNGQSIQDAQQARRDAIAALRQELAYAKEALYAKIEENGDAVAAKTLQLLTSKEEDIIAGYQNDIKAVSNNLKAEINAVSQAQSQFNNNIAAVRQEIQTLANKTTTGAKYGVYLDANGYVSGVSMNNDSKKSSFTVIADDFYIRNPYTGTVKPFYYNSRTGQLTLNGIKVDWADIQNAKIDAANITNLKVDKANIRNLVIGTSDIAANAVTNMRAYSFSNNYYNMTNPLAGVNLPTWTVYGSQGDGFLILMQGYVKNYPSGSKRAPSAVFRRYGMQFIGTVADGTTAKYTTSSTISYHKFYTMLFSASTTAPYEDYVSYLDVHTGTISSAGCVTMGMTGSYCGDGSEYFAVQVVPTVYAYIIYKR